MRVRLSAALAVAALAVLSVTMIPAAGNAAVVSAAPASHALPKWFHWGSTSDLSGGKPCIVVWGGGSHPAKYKVCQVTQPNAGAAADPLGDVLSLGNQIGAEAFINRPLTTNPAGIADVECYGASTLAPAFCTNVTVWQHQVKITWSS